MPPVDTSGLERVCAELENGTDPDRVREFCKLFPSELAKVRRQVYRDAGLRLHPVPVNGSQAKGLKLGYFMTPLHDGTLGYFQRRTDDCLQAAIASCLQMPVHLVPDLQQQFAAGVEPEEMERGIREKMKRWMDKHGVSLVYHASPPTTERRWIGVVTEPDSSHCLLMNGRECLFDPANLRLPPRIEMSEYDPADIDYGITIEG
jgi:hypothetical protein